MQNNQSFEINFEIFDDVDGILGNFKNEKKIENFLIFQFQPSKFIPKDYLYDCEFED